MKKHILGFPRIGAQRELKKALESFWKGESTLEELSAYGSSLRHKHWSLQQNADLSWVATGDFSMYDKMLDTSVMLGLLPERFSHLAPDDMEAYFTLARGDVKNNIPAMEMTKWFNTNYHYIAPEFSKEDTFELSWLQLFEEVRGNNLLPLRKPFIQNRHD